MTEAGEYKDHIIDMKELVRKIKENLSGDLTLSPHCCIFKIPTILSRHNKDAYTPNAFSFGPFHHNEEKFKPTEKIKSKYLVDLITRLSNPTNPNRKDPDTTLRTLTEAVNNVRKEAHARYAGPINMKEDEFVEVLVRDGCFIVELFRKKAYKRLRAENDPIFSMSCLLQFLRHDLILLENQIPWMVLETLYDSTLIPSKPEKPFVQLAIEFFENIFTTKQLLNPEHLNCSMTDVGHKHILDLLRNSVVLTSKVKKEGVSCGCKRIRSATSLDESGIRFGMGSSVSILDIKFKNSEGELEIPKLFIQETTEAVFRNLISLEQCCPGYEPIITSYAVLLDNLINTKEDMEILCKSNAIESWLPTADATKFFNKLYVDTFVKEFFYYSCLVDEVDEYCKRFWPRQRRVLKRDYFKHPWALISVLAASIGLILAFLQTFFSIIK